MINLQILSALQPESNMMSSWRQSHTIWSLQAKNSYYHFPRSIYNGQLSAQDIYIDALNISLWSPETSWKSRSMAMLQPKY